ncbi:DUF881 domain-containing protein [Desulfolucanica intricata]|uniref:DUF881 domain-containing protein n=1 Tax=Desulfolucanica intricata TaxID=1285191 RepID=UPI00082ECE69|nr:DUF881 domain-containing protein [Desulfolucanica intricata]
MDKTRYLSIAVVSVVLGIMLVVQFRSTVANENTGVTFDRAQELTVEMRQLEKERHALQLEIEDLSQKLNQANKGQSQGINALKSELEKIKLLAGTLAVKGPGVELLIDNLPQPERPGVDPNIFAVRDEDLLKVINELRTAGAEAISINENRIVATSEIRLAGSFINVNLTRVLPPFKIKAIGNPEILKSSLEVSGGLVEHLQDMGISVVIEKKEELIVPAYSGKQHFDYAKQS